MRPGTKRALLGGVAAVALAAVILPFAIRWSRTCEQERLRARETWTSYAAHVSGSRAEEEARVVLEHLDDDLEVALDHGEGVLATPTPDDAEGALLYREAMERLVLAHGACGEDH